MEAIRSIVTLYDGVAFACPFYISETLLDGKMMNFQTCLRRLITAFAMLLLAIVTLASPAYAFKQSDLDTLQLTKKCPSCDLSGVTLSSVDLSGAVLRDADLTGADLTGVNLTNASLARTNLSQANLSGARLDGSKLGLANLKDAKLDGASLTGAVFYGTIMPDGSIRNE